MAAAAFRWGPTWKRQAALLLDQRRCMTYRAPAEQVVYQTPSDEYGLRKGVTTCYAPPCWTRFKAGAAPAAVVFLHGRTSPAGNRRLVCIEAEPALRYTVAGPAMLPTWYFRILAPDSLRGPTELTFTPDDPFFIIGADRIFAGQPDRSDPSHFVIVYENADGRRTVDGWLRDDDTLKYRVRHVAE